MKIKKNVLNELAQLKAVGLAVEAEDEAAFFTISSKPAVNSIFGQQASLFGGQKSKRKEEVKRKHYIFMRYIQGRNLFQGLLCSMKLPTITKLDMTISLVEFIMRLHANNILHRDLRAKNIMIDPLKSHRPQQLWSILVSQVYWMKSGRKKICYTAHRAILPRKC